MKKNKLDFIIIGAQKSGTTTLFELLSKHPNVFMPAGKEVPFFTKDDRYNDGIEKYFEQYYAGVSKNNLWGKATPHYLSDDVAALRIKKVLPDVKLIAILREPADRALSHYRMSLRKGFEERGFEKAIDEQLETKRLNEARKLPSGKESEADTYVAWGEYGRLLKVYYDNFSSNQILILFTDELESDPQSVLKKIYSFLEIEDYIPESIGKRFHQGGTKERLPIQRILSKVMLIKKIWRILPVRLRSKILYLNNQLNIVKEKDDLVNYDKETLNRLHEHYMSDIDELETISHVTVPWSVYK